MAERRPAGYPKLKKYKPSRFMLPTSHYDKAKADNEPPAEVYGAAADRQQASIIFDVARQMVEMSPALLKRSKLMTATKRIVNYGNSGYYQVLSAEVGGKHGFSVSGLVFDEIHTQPNRQLYDVLTKGSSDARQNPLHFIITTAGTDRHSIAYKLHTKAVDILEGRRVDPTDEITFKWLRLNMWVSSTMAWIPDAIFIKGNEEIDMADLDLSSTGDITVKIDGIAASAASVIAMARTKVLMSPVSMMMIHNPVTIAFGDTMEMQKAINISFNGGYNL